MDIFLYLCIGLTVGVLSGTLGIGGGVLMLPALIWICGLAPGRAAGTTLAVLVVPVVLPAAYAYFEKDNIDFRAAMWIALAFGFGGYGGALLRNLEFAGEPFGQGEHGAGLEISRIQHHRLRKILQRFRSVTIRQRHFTQHVTRYRLAMSRTHGPDQVLGCFGVSSQRAFNQG